MSFSADELCPESNSPLSPPTTCWFWTWIEGRREMTELSVSGVTEAQLYSQEFGKNI